MTVIFGKLFQKQLSSSLLPRRFAPRNKVHQFINSSAVFKYEAMTSFL
jgi:hypothetical protein